MQDLILQKLADGPKTFSDLCHLLHDPLRSQDIVFVRQALNQLETAGEVRHADKETHGDHTIVYERCN
jgi:hypothetical protein